MQLGEYTWPFGIDNVEQVAPATFMMSSGVWERGHDVARGGGLWTESTPIKVQR